MEQGIAQAPKKKRTMRNVLLIIVGILLLTIILLLLLRNAMPRSRFADDAETVNGLLNTGRSNEEIQTALNEIVAAGRFAVSINPAMNLKDGKLDVRIENKPGNRYAMQVDIVIDGGEYDGTLLYSSGLIRQGLSVESGTAEAELPSGLYNCLAIFTAVEPETLEEVGTTQAVVVVSSPWGDI